MCKSFAFLRHLEGVLGQARGYGRSEGGGDDHVHGDDDRVRDRDGRNREHDGCA